MWAAVDDVWQPQFIEVLLRELDAHPEAALAMCAIGQFQRDGTALSPIHLRDAKDPSSMHALRLARAVWRFPYHVFIYGLFRTDFLRQAVSHVPHISGSDRLFMCQVALATHFRYVDEVLYMRQISTSRYSEKSADAPDAPLHSDFWRHVTLCRVASAFLLRSTVVPPRHKVYIPNVVATIIQTRVVELGLRRWNRHVTRLSSIARKALRLTSTGRPDEEPGPRHRRPPRSGVVVIERLLET